MQNAQECNKNLGTDRQHYSVSNFFRDGVRKIDYILVAKVVRTRDEMNKLTTYLENLAMRGVEFEFEKGITDKNLLFIKLTVPEDVLYYLAKVYNVILECNSIHSRIHSHRLKFEKLETILNVPDTNGEYYCLAEQTLSGRKSKYISSVERSLVLNKLLVREKFSSEELDRGLENLVKKGIISNAYPLHDSPAEWPARGPISDRQLLVKYWSNLGVWYKNQPLNLIHQYFGPQVAFYFAFLDYYIKMLVPVAVLGFLIFIYNLLIYLLFDTPRVSEICHSKEIMCPLCLTPGSCFYKPLGVYCNYAKMSCLFDNWTNILFAIIMSLWSTVFLEGWKRKEAELMYRWNLMNVESDTAIRLAYYDRTKYRRRSKITGEIEPYMPWFVQLFNYTITVVCCMGVIFIVLLITFGIILFKIAFRKLLNQTSVRLNSTFIVMCVAALLSAMFIKLLIPYYLKLAIFLTNRENPRTMMEYNNACIYKSYTMSFVNSYFPIFYLAFVKGNTFTYPGDEDQYSFLLGIKAESCQPSGCLFGMTLVLLFLMVMKTSVARILASIIKFCKRRKRIKKLVAVEKLPMWETDLIKINCGPFFITKDYLEIAIQYGYVTFFTAALPFAPLLAILTSIIELREDADKTIVMFKRPVSKRLPGIGAWNGIFNLATFLGTAFVIAFTSDIVARELYRNTHGNLKGYIMSTLSVFRTGDFSFDTSMMMHKVGNVTTCLYRGLRNPPNHAKKYKLKDEFWKILSLQLCFVVAFEQVIWVLTGILSTAIPDVPSDVVQEMNDEQMKIKEMRYKKLCTAGEKTRDADHYQIM